MSTKESTDLIVLEKLTPAVIFAPGGVDAILEKIKTEVKSQTTDISTKGGREAVASLAYKVARSKTALDKMGKDLGDANYKAWKAITAERAKIEKQLDDLRDEVRKPLTDWENAEKDRIACHENALLSIQSLTTFDSPPTSDDIRRRLDALITARPRDWQEFAKRAADMEMSVTAALNGMHQEAVRREAEIAELERLRAEEAQRQQKARDDRIAAEAAEKARVEAEQKAAREAEVAARAAEVERQRIEQEKSAAVAAAAQADAARKAAIAKAEQDAKDAAEAAEKARAAAIEAERERVAIEAARAAADAKRREEDKAYRGKIHREALGGLLAIQVPEDVAKAIIVAIATGQVPHVLIEY